MRGGMFIRQALPFDCQLAAIKPRICAFRIMGEWISLLSAFSTREIRLLFTTLFCAEAAVMGGPVFSWRAWPAPFFPFLSGLFTVSRRSGHSCQERWCMRSLCLAQNPAPHFHFLHPDLPAADAPCSKCPTTPSMRFIPVITGIRKLLPAVTARFISTEKLHVIEGLSHLPRMLNQLHGFPFFSRGAPSPPL